MSALLDTGFLLAAIDQSDDLHAACAAALRDEINPLLPDVVLPELAYMVLRDLGHSVLAPFLRAVANGELATVQMTLEDLERATGILEKYADSRVDFVDCVIVAMAERLKINRVLTVDRRHFALFRPSRCAFFEIVP